MIVYNLNVNFFCVTDGSTPAKPKAYRLQLDVTEIGGEPARQPSGQYLQVYNSTVHMLYYNVVAKLTQQPGIVAT